MLNELKEKSVNFLNALKAIGILDSEVYNKTLDFYTELIEETYEEGYDEGYDNGYENGYDNGYDNGWSYK